jgi:hypothetical protein
MTNNNRLLELMRHVNIPIIIRIGSNLLNNLGTFLEECSIEDKKLLIIRGTR